MIHKNGIFSIKLILAIALIVLLFWDIAGPFGLWKLYRMRCEHRQIYVSNQKLAKKNANLEEEIKRLKGDHKYQEQVVRQELGWVRDNEVLYKFLDREK